MGQKEGEGLSGPQGRIWARESEEGHCSAVEVVSSIWVFTAAGLPAVEVVQAPGLPGD